MFVWQIFRNSPRNGAMNYFDSAIGNGILSVYYQMGGILQKLRGRGSALIFSANQASLCWTIPV